MKKIILSNKFGYFREYNLELKEGQIEYAFLKQASVEDVKSILPLLAPIQREAYEQHYGLNGKKPISLKKIAEQQKMPLESIVKGMDMALALVRYQKDQKTENLK